MRPQLRAVVEEAYDVFGDYRIRHSLTVCHCNSCMSVEHERELLKTRLREIPAGLLAEYTGSAHNWDDGPVAREMRHFLPRYFELIALNDPPDNGGIDICLRRLAQADWRAKWPDRECSIIDRFFDELMRASLERLKLVRWPVGWRLEFDLADVLTLVITAHGDLNRVLKVWDDADDPAAAVHMAVLRSDVTKRRAPIFIRPTSRTIAMRPTGSVRFSRARRSRRASKHHSSMSRTRACSSFSPTRRISADLLHRGREIFSRNAPDWCGVVLFVDATPTEKNQMNKMIMSTIAILASATFALAAEDSSLTTKAMEDQPGTMGGSTANPTAVPDTGAATQKAMKDQPGTTGGSTDMPSAKSDGSSLSEKAMKDLPGTK